LQDLLNLSNKGRDASWLEEIRTRTAALICKIFLQHIHQLCVVPEFVELWLTIIDFIEQYTRANTSDLLVRVYNNAFLH
jgi:brefeldin A-resistance guanine nucleotide exchange factor 1